MQHQRVAEPRAPKRLFRKSDNPVLRGTAYKVNPKHAFLGTRGWIPRLRTYPGMEVPNPLSIEICQGTEAIETVLGGPRGRARVDEAQPQHVQIR